LRLTGRSALVAASSRGLGYAVARGLAVEGAVVAVSARTADAAESAAKRIATETGARCAGFACDLSAAGQPERLVSAVVERFGALDVLVTNAGGPPAGAFTQIDDARWAQSVDLTLMSVVRLVRSALPYLRKSGRGRIVNIVSSSVKEPIDGLLLSNSIRLAVVGLARTLSRELAPDGITVNNVCPGRIRTQRLLELYGGETGLARAAESIPMGRLGRNHQQPRVPGTYGAARLELREAIRQRRNLHRRGHLGDHDTVGCAAGSISYEQRLEIIAP
jgi:3-oxoacyl-[acyl-carrier protein] reductase